MEGGKVNLYTFVAKSVGRKPSPMAQTRKFSDEQKIFMLWIWISFDDVF